jgi:hypothetical protein
MQENNEYWRRLTILDILGLFPGFALGAGLVRYAVVHAKPLPYDSRPWPMDESAVMLTFVSLVLGSILSAPVSLSIQYIIRHRREWPSLGEWLWIEPIVLYVVTFLLSKIGSPTPVWLFLFVLIQLFFSVMCALMFLGQSENVACLWTHKFGMISCSLAGVALLYLLIHEGGGGI